MYPDRKRIRDNRLTVRFDDYEEQLMRALAAYLGEQPTTPVSYTHLTLPTTPYV